MKVVVSDTSPIRYLVLINKVDVLPKLYSRIFIPNAVWEELQHASAPLPVREWLAVPPIWLEILPYEDPLPEGFLPALDRGERAAIGLALDIHADLLIVDDREAVERAHEVGLNSTGTIGVIEAAGKAKLLDVAHTIRDLLLTNFRISKSVLTKVLEDADSSQ